MKYIVVILALIVFPTSSVEPIDIYGLLKRDLREEIVMVAENEIRYCPDNTCELYRSQNESILLAAYVYLHIIHSSSYTPIYRNNFILAAKEQEAVLKSVESFCSSNIKSVSCVLEGISSTIIVQLGFGRYDEGNYCYSYGDEVTTCEKL